MTDEDNQLTVSVRQMLVVDNGSRAPRGQPGVYALQHEASKMMYIGSTNNLGKRRDNHLSKLERNIHHNKPLQEAYNDDPNVNFAYRQTIDREEAYDLEQQLLDAGKDTGVLFNVATDARVSQKGNVHWIGRTHTETTKRQMSESRQGRIFTEETKAKIAISVSLAMSKPFEINGVVYRNQSEAAKALNICMSTARKQGRYVTTNE